MYGCYQCEYCEGTVQPRVVKREAFKHRDGFVILEDVTLGDCDCCGSRYHPWCQKLRSHSSPPGGS